ncbi:hypothetical protein [Actinokineospora sp. HUAS TT18]|uniref:hypothetical protein n=1 Tax=Actinokineospora sp. HUAS TT18 TaxID=3447451 RepID=UPI003F521E9D
MRNWLLRAGAIAIAMAPLGVPATAAAHESLVLILHDNGRGGVTVDLAWTDGHPIPVTSTIAASLLATSADRTVGPTALRHLPGKPTAAYDTALPPGTWQVYVDVAMPGIGQCEVTVTVEAQPRQPTSTRCGAPLPAAARAPASTRPTGLLWGLGGIAAVGAVGVGVLLFGRRRTP